jgi:hypothetical protein
VGAVSICLGPTESTGAEIEMHSSYRTNIFSIPVLYVYDEKYGNFMK